MYDHKYIKSKLHRKKYGKELGIKIVYKLLLFYATGEKTFIILATS